MKVSEYGIMIELLRQMLGTNPFNPYVMDTHILDRQRKLIAGESKINNGLTKYLAAMQISDEKAAIELQALKETIEEYSGSPLTEEEYEKLKSGEFKKFKDLRETLAELDNKGITCFFREGDKIAIGNHMILGFLKAAGEAISRTLPTKKGVMLQSNSYTASILNQHCSIGPDLILASHDIEREADGKTPKHLQRSLRGMTAQGPRVSLAKSEVLPKGTTFTFTIRVLDNSPLTEEILTQMLSYGTLHGLGQWRNAGFGQFKVVEFQKLS